MKLNINEAMTLHQALASQNLKIKNIGGDSYMKIINLKIGLKRDLLALEETYKAHAEIMGMQEVAPQQYDHSDPAVKIDFQNKIFDTNKAWVSRDFLLHFLTEEELKKMCIEQDVQVQATLFEFLLEEKEEEKK